MTSKNNGQIEPENQDSQKKQSQSYDTTSPSSNVSGQSEKQNDSAKTTTVKLEKKPANQGGKLGIIAIVMSLIFAGGGAFVFYQQNIQHQSQLAKLNAEITSMTHQLEQRISSAEATATIKSNEAYNKAETGFLQQQESIKSLQVALGDVIGRRPNDWLLAESDYLVKLAGRKLFLEKDVVTATKLMESADQRISVLNDPSLIPLRKEIATDITRLKSIALVDKDGLVLRLISLQQQVETLPLANAILPDAPTVENKVVSSDIYDWQDNLMTSLKDFSEQFITFRTREGNVVPLLAPEQHYYLKENIKGKIETAIRAVYSENQAIYQRSLKTADEWTVQFFKLDDPAVIQFDKSIQQLANQNVEIKYPVKLVSQNALKEVINDRLRRQVTSVMAEDK